MRLYITYCAPAGAEKWEVYTGGVLEIRIQL